MNFSSYDDDIKTSLKDDFENLKNNFVKETVSNINIYFLYNVNQVCEQYKKVIMPVVEGQLTKDALYSEIIKNRNDSGRRFNVNGIYAYNFDVDELFDYIETDDQCFKEYKQVENITFKPSFDYFQHHNSIFIFLSNEKNKHTKKTTMVPRRKTIKSL